MTADRGELRCREFVELVTAYLDRTLPDAMRSSIDQHLVTCDGCRNVLGQWRAVIAIVGELTEIEIERTDPLTRDRLLSTFRDLRHR